MRMRTYPALIAPMLALFLAGCHTDKNFTQTFASEKDPSQTLTLTSKTGLVQSDASFPHNVFLSAFGSSEIDGKYEQKTPEGTVTGTFTAGKDGEKPWVRFKPADGGTEWKAVVKLGGMLADGDKVWMPNGLSAEAESAPIGITFGGN